MKATIDLDDSLYRRLKVEAARRGATVRELVAEGIRRVLETPPASTASETTVSGEEESPAWFGSLGRYGRAVDDHSMAAIRSSVAEGRSRDKGK